MVPDIEREWIAEESRTAPPPAGGRGGRILVVVILAFLIGLAVWLWLAKC